MIVCGCFLVEAVVEWSGWCHLNRHVKGSIPATTSNSLEKILFEIDAKKVMDKILQHMSFA